MTRTAQGYELTDEGEGTSPPTGLSEAGLATETEGSASSSVQFSREGGVLSGMSVVDPGTAAGATAIAGEEPSGTHVLSSEVGGIADGDLASPIATATDSSGDVFVADAGHDLVQEFGPTGVFLRRWGGEGQHRLSNIVGITIAVGKVYVAEPTRIEEFSPTGEFIRQIGSAGTGNGQFTGLAAIATDGWLGEWIAAIDRPGGESGPYRVQLFETGGGYFSKLEIPAGSGAGQLSASSAPRALAFDGEGNAWMADTADNRIEEFARGGSFTRQVGSAGTGNGQFRSPGGIAVDSSGNVWVSDTGNDRLERFSSTGTYLSQVGVAGDGEAQFSEPRGIAIDSSSNVWVADRMNDRIEKITSAGAYSAQAGGAASSGGALSRPVGTATDSSGDVYVADAGHDRVQEFGPTGSFIRQWGGVGTGNGQFGSMVGIAISPAGNVYVAEPWRIQEFSPTGAYKAQIGSFGSGPGQFESLAGISFDSAGGFVTVEGGFGALSPTRTEFFSGAGVYEGSATIPYGTGTGQAREPRAIAFEPSGHYLWIADTGGNRLEKMHLTLPGTLAFEQQVGSGGTGNGQFKAPQGIVVTSSGTIWVSDTGNDRLERFSSTGTYQSQVGAPGDGEGQFSEPLGIATDPSGNVWVADTRNDRVERLTSGGAYSAQAGGAESVGGNLSHPVGTATDSSGDAYVADAGHDRVQEFGPTGTFIRQWGAAGTGNGQFWNMVGIATEPSAGGGKSKKPKGHPRPNPDRSPPGPSTRARAPPPTTPPATAMKEPWKARNGPPGSSGRVSNSTAKPRTASRSRTPRSCNWGATSRSRPG